MVIIFVIDKKHSYACDDLVDVSFSDPVSHIR
jgi:hypothetical protein